MTFTNCTNEKKSTTFFLRYVREVRPQDKSLSPRLGRWPGGYREPPLAGAGTQEQTSWTPGGEGKTDL